MEFTLNNVCFCGFCGEKAAITQDKQLRLFYYYTDLSFSLMDKQMQPITLLCTIDHQNDIWIKKVLL